MAALRDAPDATNTAQLENRPLCAHVYRALTQLAAELGEDHPAYDPVSLAADGLTRPLRVAVGGRISKGKSTLVNALLGRRIAPTGAGETTRIVASFRRGRSLAGELVMRDAPRRPLQLVDGRLPAKLPGVREEDVVSIDVAVDRWPAATPFEVVDTPGLAGMHADADARTGALLTAADGVTRSRIRGAEALVFLMDREDATSVQAIADFAELAAQPWGRCVNVVGVLNRVDTLVSHLDNVDCWAAARRLAADLESRPQVRGRVAGIVPLIALLAETAAVPGIVSAADAEALEALAQLPAATQLRLLASADRLRSPDPEVDPVVAVHARGRLLDALGLWGLVQAIADANKGPVTAASVVAAARERSGIEALLAMLRSDLASQVDALKAQRAIALLEQVGLRAEAEGDSRLRSVLAGLSGSAQLHPLREIFALGLRAGGAQLPESLSTRLDQVTMSRTTAGKLGQPEDASPVELALTARTAAQAMQALMSNPAASGDVVRVADVLRRSYRLIYVALSEGPPSSGERE
ncbi:MAG: dynamin family protein [Actinomycetota bacterium]|nr:dynamin family protein [Actinomycetota bacterium]